MTNIKGTIICDFDGTVTTKDVLDEILWSFGESPFGPAGSAYDNGEISYREMNERFASGLRCSLSDLEEAVGLIDIRPGFSDFLKTAHKQKLGCVIVSGGWDIYIRQILEPMHPVFIRDLTDLTIDALFGPQPAVICNSLEYDGSEYKFTAHQLESFSLAPHKELVGDFLRAEFGGLIVSVGDGESDFGIARKSDFVLATATLREFCATQQIAFTSFEDFYEVSAAISNTNIIPVRYEPRRLIQNDFHK